MADFTAAILDHLLADSTITDVVGTRIRRTAARTRDDLPYIVITEVDDVPEQDLEGGSGISIGLADIAPYAVSRAATRAVSTLVFKSLNGRHRAVMGDDNLDVHEVRMVNRRMLDTKKDDGSEEWNFKDVCTFQVGYAQDETP